MISKLYFMFSRNIRVPLFFVSVVLTMAKKKPTAAVRDN